MSQILKKGEKGPVKFDFKPMGPPPVSYIKYKPKMVGVSDEVKFGKIEYMLTQEQWADALVYKNITEGMKDIVEEIIDKLEKITEKSEPAGVDK